MEISVDLEVVQEELKEWAKQEKLSVPKLIEYIVLRQCKIFLYGKSAGLEKGHLQTMDAIESIGANAAEFAPRAQEVATGTPAVPSKT